MAQRRQRALRLGRASRPRVVLWLRTNRKERFAAYGARRTEQLVILSVAIVLGGVGFAFHPLWIAAVVVMALLWGYMASEMRSTGWRRRV